MSYLPCEVDDPIVETSDATDEKYVQSNLILTSGDNKVDTATTGSRRPLKWVVLLAAFAVAVALVCLVTFGASHSTTVDRTGEVEDADAIVQEFLNDDDEDDDDDQWPADFFQDATEAEEAAIKLDDDQDDVDEKPDGEDDGAASRALLSPRALLSSSNKKKFLKYHNQVRCMHGLKSLKWSKKIAKGAQKWANKCNGNMIHSNSKYGENLAWASPKETAKGAVKGWYNEIKYTSRRRIGRVSSFSSGTGHYTQLVWKGTTTFGCGMTKTLAVCRYSKAGNMGGQFKKNVGSPKHSKKSCKKKR